MARYLRDAWLTLGIGIILGQMNLQAQGTTGTIQGTVTDTSAAVIAGAELRVTNAGTAVSQTVISDQQGRYIVPLLPVGEYEVQSSKTGFSTVIRKDITLTVGSQLVVDFSLPVGQAQQTVTVEATVSQVDTTSSTVSSLVSETQMRELPLNGRDFEQLILLAPGVQSYNLPTYSAYQGRAAAYSVSGARPDGQQLLLDDENLQTFWDRGVSSIIGTSLGVEAIAEFQMLTDTYPAQFGGMGAVMNAVSKPGTNQFHGSAFEFLRNSDLDARNFFDKATVAPFRRNQFGGSVGGPIKKDKLFFFANYEGIRQSLGETKIANVPTCNVPGVCTPSPTLPASVQQAIINTLALFPAPTSIIGNGIGNVTEVDSQVGQENYFLGRVDYVLSSKDTLFGRYIADKAHLVEPFSTSPIPSWQEGDDSLNQFSTLEEKRVISATLVNSVRVSFSRTNSAASNLTNTPALNFFPNDPTRASMNGEVSISGLSTIGPNSFNPFYLIENKYAEGDDLIWTRGSHTILFGGSIRRVQANTLFPYRSGGVWTFSGLTPFLQGLAATFVAPVTGQENSIRDFREIDFQTYVQDDWKVSRRLTLNLGLRYEPTTNPVEAHGNLSNQIDPPYGTFVSVPNVFNHNPSLRNVDPRIGFAYDPFADHKTSIRAGFGIFRELITPAIYAVGYETSFPYVSLQQSNTTYPTPFTGSAPALPTNNGFDPTDSVTPYLIEYNFNVEREIAPNTVLSAAYVGSHGVHMWTSRDENPPIPTVDSSGVDHFSQLINGKIVTNPLVNPQYGVITNLVPTVTSLYNSLQVGLNHRLSNNFTAQGSYTWSKCMDDGSFRSTLSPNSPNTWGDPYNEKYDVGRCVYDITQTLRINGVYALPFHQNKLVSGWQLSGIQTWNTGFPFTVTDGFDQPGFAGGATGRPNYVLGCNPLTGFETVAHWYNPGCFSIQPVGTLGNLGRTTVQGPGLVDTDFAVFKDTRFESLSVQFRAELFNIFNHANFGLPNIGAFVQGANGTASPSPTAGQITSTTTTSRQIQFGLKLVF